MPEQLIGFQVPNGDFGVAIGQDDADTRTRIGLRIGVEPDQLVIIPAEELLNDQYDGCALLTTECGY